MLTLPRRLTPALSLLALLALGACTDQPSIVGPARDPAIAASPLYLPDQGRYSQMDAISDMCAVRTDGSVKCWSATGSYERTAAVGVFTAVSTDAGQKGCALRSDGAIECWGINNVTLVTTPAGGTVFVQVGAGLSHACGLRDDGVIQCWGRDDMGEAQPSYAATSGVFVELAVRPDLTCGRTSLGAIECYGNLSDPVDPSNNHMIWAASQGTFTRLVMGPLSPCGIRTAGDVECHPFNAAWNVVPLPGVFVDYSFSVGSHCGLTATGVAQCGGGNAYGQAPPTRTASVGSFTQVRSANAYSCGLRTDGGIDCWGRKGDGAVTEVLPTASFTAPASVIVGQPIALALTNAQVPGYPQATTFTYAFDCGSGSFAPTVPGSASTASCPTSAPGTRAVRGKVLDADQSEAVYAATVTVKSAAQGTTDLIGEIQVAPLQPDLRKALTAKLDAALAAIAKGKTGSACAALRDFINQVNAQRGKAIPIATADGWILTAQQLQGAIGC